MGIMFMVVSFDNSLFYGKDNQSLLQDCYGKGIVALSYGAR